MTEHKQFVQWMIDHGLDRHKLAELIGYAPETIYWMQRGCTPPNRNHKSGNAKDRRIKPWVWQRFKMACAGLDTKLKTGTEFNW